MPLDSYSFASGGGKRGTPLDSDGLTSPDGKLPALLPLGTIASSDGSPIDPLEPPGPGAWSRARRVRSLVGCNAGSRSASSRHVGASNISEVGRSVADPPARADAGRGGGGGGGGTVAIRFVVLLETTVPGAGGGAGRGGGAGIDGRPTAGSGIVATWPDSGIERCVRNASGDAGSVMVRGWVTGSIASVIGSIGWV